MFVMVTPTKVLFSGSGAIFGIVLLLGALISALIVAITAFTGGYMRKFKNNLANKNITLDELNADMEGASKISRLFIGRKYIVEASLTPTVRNMTDVVWLYPQKTNTNGNAVTYSVISYTRNHECVRYPVHSMDEAEQLCKTILSAQPRALYGYVIENSTMYYSHFNELIDRVYNQPQQQEATAQADDASSAAGIPPSAAPSEVPSQPESPNNDILRPGI